MLPKPILANSITPESVDQRIIRHGLIKGVRLRVWENDEHYRRVSRGICKDQDMILDNFANFMAAQFLAAISGVLESTVSLKNTAGAACTFKIISQDTNYIWNYADNNGVRVGVGTVDTGLARTNVTLAGQVGSWTASAADALWTSATGKITFAGDVLIAAGATVKEAAIIVKYRDSGGTFRDIAFLRDVFAGVDITAGHYAHCDYEIAC